MQMPCRLLDTRIENGRLHQVSMMNPLILHIAIILLTGKLHDFCN